MTEFSINDTPLPEDQPDHGLTDAEFWASLDRELERSIHGGHQAVSTMAEERFAAFDRDGEGL